MKKDGKYRTLGLKKKQQKTKKMTLKKQKVIYGWLVDPPISLKAAEAVVGRDGKYNKECRCVSFSSGYENNGLLLFLKIGENAEKKKRKRKSFCGVCIL